MFLLSKWEVITVCNQKGNESCTNELKRQSHTYETEELSAYLKARNQTEKHARDKVKYHQREELKEGQ